MMVIALGGVISVALKPIIPPAFARGHRSADAAVGRHMT
jgi:hypothetical protein